MKEMERVGDGAPVGLGELDLGTARLPLLN